MRATDEASELVQPATELNVAIHRGKIIISIRKDRDSFLGTFFDTKRAREVAQHILDLADEIDRGEPWGRT